MNKMSLNNDVHRIYVVKMYVHRIYVVKMYVITGILNMEK